MMLKWRDNKVSTDPTWPGPAPASWICEFETRLDVALPEDYTEFLKTVNGGGLYKDVIDLADGTEVAVDRLYSIGSQSDDCYDLQGNWESWKPFVPAGMLPIAGSPTGDVFLLHIHGPVEGVSYCDHEGMIITPVAVSFLSFWDRLKRAEDKKNPESEAAWM